MKHKIFILVLVTTMFFCNCAYSEVCCTVVRLDLAELHSQAEVIVLAKVIDIIQNKNNADSDDWYFIKLNKWICIDTSGYEGNLLRSVYIKIRRKVL